ncbi:MAG: MoaD/ThiS family protein [Brevundimonas sp.]|uniref:MoaD/ThiS family protein n=1 Tax=Brevundimonas albigilva TaxID=1312364 RepID=A0ABY4SJ51_9CAUL|nr:MULTISPECIES: MoaD/ThiS family protein [Brevundimonas]MCV0416564.1 MoaD/ThiS family protein [Brevundimonas sp.]URI15005.1 MoaD/ThiS family protein [Brevundimonas albigilva]
MDIRILLLGDLGARFGREHTLAFTEGLTVGELRRRLIEGIEGSEVALSGPAIRLAVDQVVVSEAAPVRPGQEVAVLPIFSGG